MNLAYLQSNYSGSCASCGDILEISNPRAMWLEKGCSNCGRSEGETYNLSELIDLAESQPEF